MNHALVCFEGERYDDTLTLLDGFLPSDPEQRVLVTTLVLKAGGRTMRWDEALAAARRPEAAPADLAWLGSKLVREGRTADARELLLRACPVLQGEVASQCADLLAGLDGG